MQDDSSLTRLVKKAEGAQSGLDLPAGQVSMTYDAMNARGTVAIARELAVIRNLMLMEHEQRTPSLTDNDEIRDVMLGLCEHDWEPYPSSSPSVGTHRCTKCGCLLNKVQS